MCLAIPGEILEILDPPEGGLRTGQVSFAGVTRQVCLAYVPEARIGDFVLVHAGFAIARVDEAHAREALELLSRPEPGGDA
jgi:hydrogenase expression/formation protein HypC